MTTNRPAQTHSAVARLARLTGYKLDVSETSHGRAVYRLYDDLGPWGQQTICQCAQMDDGRWISAGYSERHLEWQSADMTKSFLKYNQGFRYAFANTLEGLADYGVRTYQSATACLRRGIAAYEH